MLKSLDVNEDFEKDVSKGLWLIDFSAGWCMPCQMLHSELEIVSKNFNILQIDIDTFRGLAIKYEVDCVPTLILLKDGKMIKKVTGFRKSEELMKFIEDN